MTRQSTKDPVLFEMVSVLADAVIALQFIAVDLIYQLKDDEMRDQNLEKLTDFQRAIEKYVELITRWRDR